MLPYLRYKEKEADLQKAFGLVPIVVDTISATDNYYTDGDSTKSLFKVVIDSLNTVYLPQFIYNVDPVYKRIIKEWMDTIENA